MLTISLLDGSKLEFNNNPTPLEVANKISPSLAKASIYAFVSGVAYDLYTPITQSGTIEIITTKNEAKALEVLRHSTAHLMAQAILQLFPGTKLATGPVIENGFFYDVLPAKPFKEEDLEAITKRMHQLIDEAIDVRRYSSSKIEAIEKYKKQGEVFKVDVLNEIKDNEVSFYKQGDFEDMCRGVHVDNTKKIPKSFKLAKLSGVYWQGDAKNPMLQRITGVAFLTQKDLDNYQNLQVELEKNDHRKLGREMNLFHMSDEAVGNVFWHNDGWIIYKELENYIRNKLNKNHYFEVKTPQLLDKKLWEMSGHWDKYRDNMFIVNNGKDSSGNEEMLALKPMNCPAHILIFKQGTKSYKDLPLRMAEFGSCHRNESSGSLHGIMRVRGFTQDDAHIFCTSEQIITETISFCKLLKEVYKDILGDVDLSVKFSDRPLVRAGDDATWDKAEEALLKASKEAGLDVELSSGEGAFYGPKLEFTIKDTFGRGWQCGTLQVDFILPQRLGATYVGEDGEKHTPVILHRAILGSMERFIGILLENFKGHLPLWLAPKQIVIAGVSNKFDDYANKVKTLLESHNIRVHTDLRSEKISYKIREHSLAKVPLVAVVGEKEVADNTITLRILGSEQQITLPVDEFLVKIKDIIANKKHNLVV